MGRSRVLEEPFKDSQQVSFSRYFLCLPNKRFNKFCTDGFLVLGHDVDRYSSDDTIPVRQNHNSIQVFRSTRTSCTTSGIEPTRLQEKSGSLIYRHICLMNHEKNHQTNPMAPWDPLDALLTPWTPWPPQSTPSDP